MHRGHPVQRDHASPQGILAMVRSLPQKQRDRTVLRILCICRLDCRAAEGKGQNGRENRQKHAHPLSPHHLPPLFRSLAALRSESCSFTVRQSSFCRIFHSVLIIIQTNKRRNRGSASTKATTRV